VTAPVVMDASVGLALVRTEADSERWHAGLGGWIRAGRRVLVPAHFWLEVVNPLVVRYRYSSAEALEAIHALDDLVTETIEVGRATLLLAIDHAERFRLTVYDATYLALAEVLDADLATSDRALELAAGSRLVDLDGPPAHRLSEPAAAYGSSRVTWPDYSGAASYLASLRAGLREVPR
jgi:predicted nucleic acid-binding protein